MRVILMVAIATLAVAFSPPVQADTFLSYHVAAGNYGPNDINGVGVKVHDLFNFTTSTIVVSLPGVVEDLDAAHVLADGKILLSSSTDIFGFGATSLNFSSGDLVLYDPSTNTANIVLSELNLFGVAVSPSNIDAVYKFESGANAGKYVLSTTLGATIGGSMYDARDLVLYDPGNLDPQNVVAPSSSLYLDGDFIGGTLNGRNINAVHVLDNGNVVFSTFAVGGTIDGLSPFTNFIEYNPSTGDATLFLDGDIFDSISARNLDALSISSSGNNQGPEPTTFVLASLALLAALSLRHRL